MFLHCLWFNWHICYMRFTVVGNLYNFVRNKLGLNLLDGKMAALESMQRLESRAQEAENLIAVLKAEVSELRAVADFCKKNVNLINTHKYEQIQLENEKLKKDIEHWKSLLIEAEKKLSIEPVHVDLSKTEIKDSSPAPVSVENTQKKDVSEKREGSEKKEVSEKKEKAKSGEQKKTPSKAAAPAADDLPVDVRRLDIRVGKIINVKKHPDADSLYVEEVDLGEGKPRTVVSGLVKYIPIEEMENRMVVALCNLKPAKMRGVTSEAMVLCASTPEKVEVLSPPEGSVPGDRIQVEGFSGEPDPVLNPKKKIFETVAPDLKTDGQLVATYKGIPFTVPGKGVVKTQSLSDVQIK